MKERWWINPLVALLIALILGSYGYTYTYVSNMEDKIIHRLDRMEDYLLDLISEVKRKEQNK